MLVHLQIALAVELEPEAAVLGQLLQHVVEETDSGGHFGSGRCVEIDFHDQVRLAGLAAHAADPRRIDDLADELLPTTRLPGVDPEATHAQVVGELQVGVAVADHHAGVAIHRSRAHEFIHQAGARLAAFAAVFGNVRANEDFGNFDPLGGEQRHQEFVRAVEVFLWEAVGSEPVLVADHHQFEAGILQFPQRGHDALRQPELRKAVDLEVGRLLDQGAVTVHECDARAHAAALSVASRPSFCSGVPSVMRTQDSSPGSSGILRSR